MLDCNYCVLCPFFTSANHKSVRHRHPDQHLQPVLCSWPLCSRPVADQPVSRPTISARRPTQVRMHARQTRGTYTQMTEIATNLSKYICNQSSNRPLCVRIHWQIQNSKSVGPIYYYNIVSLDHNYKVNTNRMACGALVLVVLSNRVSSNRNIGIPHQHGCSTQTAAD